MTVAYVAFSEINWINIRLHIKKMYLCIRESKNARMAELADALVSGTSVGNNVQVRPLFRAQYAQVVKLVYTLL